MRDAILLLGFVTLQRLAELWLSSRNETRLKARGAVEAGSGHYPVMVLLHTVWLAGLWWLAWDTQPNLWCAAIFVALQGLRYWVIASLGERWTTRVFVLPGEAPIRRGPYRFLDHPNYVIVVIEIALLPIAFGLFLYAVVFSALNACLLAWRIHIEARALADAAAGRSPALAKSGKGG